MALVALLESSCAFLLWVTVVNAQGNADARSSSGTQLIGPVWANTSFVNATASLTLATSAPSSSSASPTSGSKSSGIANYILHGIGAGSSTTGSSNIESSTTRLSSNSAGGNGSAASKTSPASDFGSSVSSAATTSLVRNPKVNTNTSRSSHLTSSPATTWNSTTATLDNSTLDFLVSSAWSCLLALSTYDWLMYDDGERTEVGSFTTRIPNDIWTYTSTEFYGYQTFTLCDGVPRVTAGKNASSQLVTHTSTIITAHTTIETSWSTFSPPCKSPDPTLAPQICPGLGSLYQAANTLQSANSKSRVPNVVPDMCPMSDWDPAFKTFTPTSCVLEVQSAQLFYWPVSVVSGDFCNQTGTTITATPTIAGQPNTYDMNGTTLTSPTVYVSFYELYYFSSSANFSTTYTTDTFIPFAATEISSQCGYHGAEGFSSFNYADLYPNPVPWSAYSCQAYCWFNASDCIPISAPYAPALAFPTTFSIIASSLHAQGPCQLGVENNGIWDPPVALAPVQSLQGPTVPAPAHATATPATAVTTVPQVASPSQTATLPPQQTPASPSDVEPTTQPGSGTPAVVPGGTPTVVSPSTHAIVQSTPSEAPEALPDEMASSSSAGRADPSPTTNDDSPEPALGISSPVTPAETHDPSPASSAIGIVTTSDNAGGVIASLFGYHGASDPTISGTTAQPADPTISAEQTIVDPTTSPIPSQESGHAVQGATSARIQGVHDSASPSAAVVIVGSSALTADAASGLVVGSSTLTAGGAAATIENGPSSGVVISVASQGVVVDDSTVHFSLLDTPLTMTGAEAEAGADPSAGSTAAAAMPQSSADASVGHVDLTIGGAAVTLTTGPSAGAVVSAMDNGLVVDGSTVPYSVIPAATPGAATVFTAGSLIYTVVPGSSALDGNFHSAGDHSVQAAAAGDPKPTDVGAVLTVGSTTLTATSVHGQSNAVVIDGTTLTPGGPAATIAGAIVSNAPSGIAVVRATTVPLSHLGSGSLIGAVVTIPSSSFTAVQIPENSHMVEVDGTTLTAGGQAMTIADAVISEGTAGIVIADPTTVALSAITVPTVQGTTRPGSSGRSASVLTTEGASSGGSTVAPIHQATDSPGRGAAGSGSVQASSSVGGGPHVYGLSWPATLASFVVWLIMYA